MVRRRKLFKKANSDYDDDDNDKVHADTIETKMLQIIKKKKKNFISYECIQVKNDEERCGQREKDPRIFNIFFFFHFMPFKMR